MHIIGLKLTYLVVLLSIPDVYSKGMVWHERYMVYLYTGNLTLKELSTCALMISVVQGYDV